MTLDTRDEMVALLWEVRAFMDSSITMIEDEDTELLRQKVIAVTDAAAQMDRALRSKLIPTGDAHRDRLVAERINLRSA